MKRSDLQNVVRMVAGGTGQQTGPRWSRALPEGPALRFVIDSRGAATGTAFIALPGTRVDGHEFLETAARSGAVVLIASADKVSAERERALHAQGATLLYAADDVLLLMQALAAEWRRRFVYPIIGITGTAGKTTTKEMLCHVLSAAGWRVAFTPGNHNNHIGLPLSLLNAPHDADIGVFEVGISLPGEMAGLARILAPDYALLVSVGAAHLEDLGSVEVVAREKLGLLAAVSKSGIVWMPAGLPVLDAVLSSKDPSRVSPLVAQRRFVGETPDADVRVLDIAADRVRFVVADREHGFSIPGAGAHLHADGVFVVSVAQALGIDLAEACVALASFEAQAQRNQWLTIAGVTVLDDSYNANVLSMAAALQLVAEKAQTENARLVLVLGEMLEMGAQAPALHREIGALAGRCGAQVIAFVGGQNEAYRRGVAEALGDPGTGQVELQSFKDSEDAARWARRAIRAGDLVLLKGSRGVKVEAVREALEDEAGLTGPGTCAATPPSEERR